MLTASIASLRSRRDLLPYETSEHATRWLIQGAIVDSNQGVRVNAVAPGLFPTQRFAAVAGASRGGNAMSQRRTTVRQRRTGSPGEGTGVIAFLLRDDTPTSTLRWSYWTLSPPGCTRRLPSAAQGRGARRRCTTRLDLRRR